MARSWQGYRSMLPPALAEASGGSSWADATGMILDASTEKLAFKYYPQTTSAITDVDVRLNVIGAPGNFRIGIFADASNAPDDATQLGGYSGNWTIGADGMTGLQTLASNTGALTRNVPVWVVIEYVSGTIDGSNYIQLQRLSNATSSYGLDLQRHHNGTNWTTTASQVLLQTFAVKHADATYGGLPLQLILRSTSNDIYVNGGTVQTQGVKWRTGAQQRVIGVMFYLTKTGTPNDLVITVYEGDTSKDSTTLVAANVQSGAQFAFFNAPILLAADTDLTILFTQTGTSDSNDYDLHTWAIDAAYLSAVAPSNMRFVSGNGVVPSALTASTTQVPFCVPVWDDESADFDSTSGGGPLVQGRLAK